MNLLFKKLVFLYHPEYVKELLTNPEYIDRPIINQGLKSIADNALLLLNGSKWEERKKKLSPLYNENNLDSYIHEIEKHSLNLLQKLNKNCQEWIYITPMLKECFYEIITSIISEYPRTTTAKDVSLILSTSENMTEIFIERIFNIFLWSDLIFSFTTKGKKFQKNRNIARQISRKVVENLIKEGLRDQKKGQTFSGNLLRCLTDKTDDFTVESFIDEIMAITDAGLDTSGNTLSWTLYEIGKNEDVQRNIQEEIETVFQNDKFRNINRTDLDKLQYLKCVIKETMRMYPGIPFTARVSNRKHVFGDNIYPKNSYYIISLFHLHRSAEQYPDPDIFQPSRFLPENSKNRHLFSFLPFSAGRRSCPGKKLAMLQMKICLVTIMRHFVIESAPEKCVPMAKGVSLSSNKPHRIRVLPRI